MVGVRGKEFLGGGTRCCPIGCYFVAFGGGCFCIRCGWFDVLGDLGGGLLFFSGGLRLSASLDVGNLGLFSFGC
ncbi:hypothetical protein U1Q18_015229 [Sarracenia purpurea var. burkii]